MFSKIRIYFENRVKVPQYIEDRVNEVMTDEGIFILEGFFDEYAGMISTSGIDETTRVNGEQASTLPDRDLFINRFIGTMLWLIKYRTLSTAKNGPRKLAHLDLRFDIEMPLIIEKHFEKYDVNTIQEAYDNADIECKKAFTGEMQREERPRFMVSPIWAKNPEPHPVKIAARILVSAFDQEVPDNRETANENLENMMKERFMEFSQSAADSCKEINFVWMLNRQR
jgi:hypothetical protein